jgi:urease accessory protein
VYLLHPPGGLVSGDLLRIQVRLEEGARALLTTPGAGRVYRARADRRLQQQLITLDVSDGGSIEWLPQETIVYPDACGALDLQVDLGAASKFIGWEISCLGLPASGQDFDRGSIRQRICIQRRDRPLLVENFTLDDTCRTVYAAAAGLQSCPVNAVFIAGEIPQQQTLDTPDETFLQALESKLQALVSARLPRGLAGVSLVNGFVVARYLGTCSEEAKQLFIQLWKLVRPLLIERPALLPRIWAT